MFTLSNKNLSSSYNYYSSLDQPELRRHIIIITWGLCSVTVEPSGYKDLDKTILNLSPTRTGYISVFTSSTRLMSNSSLRAVMRETEQHMDRNLSLIANRYLSINLK